VILEGHDAREARDRRAHKAWKVRFCPAVHSATLGNFSMEIPG